MLKNMCPKSRLIVLKKTQYFRDSMFKDKQHMLNEIFCLMDRIREHLKRDSNIDNFIDNDDELDKWAKIIPKFQYPIFIISVLNNIRSSSILDEIIDSSFTANNQNSKLNCNKNKKRLISSYGEQPFN